MEPRPEKTGYDLFLWPVWPKLPGAGHLVIGTGVEGGKGMNQGEASAVVSALFEASYGSLLHYAYRRTGNLDVAEELVQDTLLALYCELRRGKQIDHLKAWSLSVLDRKARKELGRRLRMGSQSPLEDLEVEPASLAVPTGHTRGLFEIQGLLSALSRREQEVVLLRMESLKYCEIARLLNISRNSVNTLLGRALRKLQVAAGRNKPDQEPVPSHVERRTGKTLQ